MGLAGSWNILLGAQSFSRAMEFAQSAQQNPKSNIKKPSALGAVIDLGYCLDLLDYQNFRYLRNAFAALSNSKTELELPKNKSPKNTRSEDFLFRELDCTVLEAVHDINKEYNLRPFDSVRVYSGKVRPCIQRPGFKDKNHIQICIRNPNCIKGFFIPREVTDFKGIID